MQVEICQNCGRKIGNLEQAYIYQEHIICKECYKLLNDSTSKDKKDGKKVQTIELTAKKYKAAMLIGLLLAFSGIPVLEAGYYKVGILLGFGGVALFIVARIEAWWHHG